MLEDFLYGPQRHFFSLPVFVNFQVKWNTLKLMITDLDAEKVQLFILVASNQTYRTS